MQTETELVWHNDGHVLSLRIEKSELVITGILCPHVDESPDCHLTSDGCAVKWFINRFGLECNVGICSPAPQVEIAWAFTGNTELGIDSCQLWVIPTTDEFFAAWAATQIS